MWRTRLAVAGVALCAALTVPLPGARAAASTTAGSAMVTSSGIRSSGIRSSTAPGARPVVIVGISGLRWNQLTPAATPQLWRLASGGSVGSLVDYAQQPLACPADGWLTLNAAARAQGPRPCALPAPTTSGRDGQGRGP